MKKVLVVVDYQNDFVDGALGFEGAEKLDDGISEIMTEYAKDEDGEVICTFDTHDSNYLDTQEGRKLPIPHCSKDTDGWQLYGKVAMVEIMYPMKCTRVTKPTFGSLSLAEKLRKIDKEHGVKSITFVGVVTNMCVISNAVIAKAACPEAEIIIKKDLVDSFDKEMHQKALDVMASMQMTVE